MKEYFSARQKSFQDLANFYSGKSNWLSNVRLGLFVVTLFVGFILYKIDYSIWILVLVFVAAVFYIKLVINHNKIKYARHKAILSAKVNQEEVDRLNGDLKNLESVDVFRDLLHPYAKDLDVFGDHSIFKLISRCSGVVGQMRLSHVLSKGRTKGDISQSQEASHELQAEIDYRQEFQVLGMIHGFNTQQKTDFDSWLQSPGKVVSTWLVSTLNGISAIVIMLILFGYSWPWIFIPITLNILFLSLFKKHISTATENASDFSGLLSDLCKQLEMIENKKFQSQKLKAIQQSFSEKASQTSIFLKLLAHKFSMLEYARNPYFYVVVNFTFLWDLHWYRSIDKDREAMKSKFDKWLEDLGEFEVLSSFAATRYANPDWVYPEISDEVFLYRTEQIAHPLLISESKVANSLSMQETGKAWVLTGSNMAGKSTFLRTLAVNAVLAMAGGPVCAKTCTLSMMRIFSSMRTEDNLQESTSSFYAELKRLKLLLDTINNDLPVFYVLDEILKGTNSRDRQAGSYAFIKKLLDTHSSGIIATHDIELGQLADEFPGKVRNYHFSSEVLNGNLHFDYQLKTGICQSFNATQLMKSIGIEVEESDYKM